MASQQQQQPITAPPHVVGHAFAQQYYHILHQSPELVHRFYQDISKLGRPDSASVMSSVTTMQAINEKILSLEFSEYRAEIVTVDAQESYNGGVLVLVTGYLTGKDNIKKNFTQTFFLAPQEKGYFVLNDMFRYVEPAGQHLEGNHSPESPDNGPGTPASHEHDTFQAQEQESPEPVALPEEEEEEVHVEEVYNPSDNDEGSVVDEETPTSEVVDEVPNSSQLVTECATVITQEEPKKSYASIVKVMRENAAPTSSSVPAIPIARPAHVNPERQSAPVPTSSPTPEVPISVTSEAANSQESEVDGYSIYIKNLPLNAMPTQLEEEFKRFGPIKPGGIQVRSHKAQGFCFGFVEFEVASAVQSAIEASPISIGGRNAYVEEKRPSSSRIGGGRGRFTPGRGGGGYRGGDGSSIRGRGPFGGGVRGGYGRGADFSNRSDFVSRGGGGGRSGSSGRGESAYQRVDHAGNDGGRTNRAGVPTKTAGPRVSTPPA